jgi:hypothetical protein
MKLLRWLAGAELAAEMSGDLEEERRRRAATSPVGARLWQWRAAAGLMAYFAALRLGALARTGTQGALRLAGTPGPELRQAARSLRRTPWYAATITGVMALTIALASTVFAVVDGVLFKPLPYPDADELFAIQPGFQDASVRGTPSVSPRELDAWRSAIPDVQFTGFDFNGVAMIEAPNDPALGLAFVQPNFFDVLGIAPLAGGLQPADFAPASAWPRLLISHELWQRRFGADPDIVGRDVEADPRIGRLRIAGVMPRDFVLPDRVNAHVLAPPAGLANRPTERSLTVLARAPRGTGADALRDRLEAVMRRLAEGQPLAPDGRRFLGPFDRATVVPLATWMTGRTAPLFRALAAAVIGLVLIASLNVAGLTAARVLDRARDIALRRAVGARSTDIAREHLIEQAVLFGAGAAAGLALAVPMLRTSLTLLPNAGRGPARDRADGCGDGDQPRAVIHLASPPRAAGAGFSRHARRIGHASRPVGRAAGRHQRPGRGRRRSRRCGRAAGREPDAGPSERSWIRGRPSGGHGRDDHSGPPQPLRRRAARCG